MTSVRRTMTAWTAIGGLLTPLIAGAEGCGAAAAEINLTGVKDDDVEVTAKQGGHTRIIWSAYTMLVFGWVSNSALVKASSGFGEAYGVGGLGLSGTGGSTFLRCPHDLPLSARVGGVQQRIGVVTSGTQIEPVRIQSQEVSVRFPHSTATSSPGAEFLVEASLLQDCQ